MPHENIPFLTILDENITPTWYYRDTTFSDRFEHHFNIHTSGSLGNHSKPW